MLDHYHISWGLELLLSRPWCVLPGSVQSPDQSCGGEWTVSGACVTSRSDNTAEKIYTRWRCHRPLCSPVFADGGLTRRCAHHGYTAVSVNDTHTEMCVCRHISYQSHTKTAKAFPACPLCSEPCIKAHYIFFLTRHLIRERRPSVPGCLTLQAELLRPFATKENSSVIYGPLFAL